MEAFLNEHDENYLKTICVDKTGTVTEIQNKYSHWDTKQVQLRRYKTNLASHLEDSLYAHRVIPRMYVNIEETQIMFCLHQ